MYTNRPHCTVYEKTIHNRTPTYVRHVLDGIYFEHKHGQSGGTDRTPDDHALILIPEKTVTYLPKPDDRIVIGISVAEQPPNYAMTVKSVRDFRQHGSARVRHVEVTAK